jgi:hypothetical protein
MVEQSVPSLEVGRYEDFLCTDLPLKMEQSSEMLAFKIQMLGNHLEESIRHSEHRESVKSLQMPVTCVTPCFVRFLGRKDPRHAFLRTGIKADLRHVKEPCDLRASQNRRPN